MSNGLLLILATVAVVVLLRLGLILVFSPYGAAWLDLGWVAAALVSACDPQPRTLVIPVNERTI